MLLRLAPRTLGGGPIKCQHLLGVGRGGSEWGPRTTKGALLEDVEDLAYLQPVFQCLQFFHAPWARRVIFQV